MIGIKGIPQLRAYRTLLEMVFTLLNLSTKDLQGAAIQLTAVGGEVSLTIVKDGETLTVTTA